MKKTLISVIVPVYNSEQYLHCCIDSILSQIYTNFELLLIDDGSKDNSGRICDEYAEKDSRVRVFHKENGGVSSARNIGIDNAKGNWITFVDSDDWIETEYLSNFSKEFDLSLQGYFNGDIPIQYSDCTISHNPGAEYLNRQYVYGPYCKLFKKDIINKNNIRFDLQLSYGEDILFLLEYILHAENMHVTSYVGYHYIHYKNSLSSRIRTYEDMYIQYFKHIQVFEIILKECSYKYVVMREEIFNMFFDYRVVQNISFKSIYTNEFCREVFDKYLNQIDKLVFKCDSTFLIKLYKKITRKIQHRE